MNHMFSQYCTNPNCQDEHPEPIKRSKGWAYCRPCYIRAFPAAALRNGIAKPDHPVIAKHFAVKNNRKKAEMIRRVRDSLPTLFDIEGGK